MNLALILVLVTTIFCNGCMSDDSSRKHHCSVAECIRSGNNDLSTVVLCNKCLEKMLSHTDTALLFHEAQQKLDVIDEGKYRRELAHLNQDVLSIIFDNLEVADMINLLEGYPHKMLFAAAESRFKRRFKDSEVFVNRKDFDGKNIVDENGSMRIEITNQMAPKILRCFGGAIRHLSIDFALFGLSKYIRYARKSLTHLNLGLIDEDTFQIFDMPFTQVEELSFVLRYGMKTGTLPFGQIFPKIRRLKVDALHDFYVDAFPHLIHLDVNVTPEKNNLFDELLRKNPQIESVRINRLTQDISNMINEHLTTLEILDASRLDVVNDTQFENVKHLQITAYLTESLNRLTFPRLETLLIDYLWRVDEEITAVYIEFFKRHTNVHQLTIKAGIVSRNVTLLIQMLNELPNLVEFTVFNYEGNYAAIPTILQSLPNLVKISFCKFYIIDNELILLRETLGNDWNITAHREGNSDRRYLSLEKLS